MPQKNGPSKQTRRAPLSVRDRRRLPPPAPTPPPDAAQGGELLVGAPLDRAILDLLLARGENGLSARAIAERLDGAGIDRQELRDRLKTLAREGRLEKIALGYRIAAQRDLVEGTLKFGRTGHATLRTGTGTGGGDDLFVPSFLLANFREGDRVRAERMRINSTARKDGKIDEARNLALVSREPTRVMGRYEAGVGRRPPGIEPEGFGYGPFIEIDAESLSGVSPKPTAGQLVAVLLPGGEDRSASNLAKFERTLGWPGTFEAELARLYAMHDLNESFPAAVLDQARRVPEAVPASDIEAPWRKDLRKKPFVTIDGADARDFDDAVCAEKTRTGYRLWVAIADVAHYVRPTSPIDDEARRRGTSVYLPHRAIHMLPEVLSAGLCSLKPNEARLAMVAEMHFTTAGEPTDADFYAATIESNHRLTYEQVEAEFYGGKPADPPFPFVTAKVEKSLATLVELAKILRTRRFERGSLDFNLSEPKVLFETVPGLPAGTHAFDGPLPTVRDIGRRDRLEAHKLIEEMMLAANESTARFLAETNTPAMYRIHEAPDPDKLAKFAERATRFGVPVKLGREGSGPAVRDIQAALASIVGKPFERPLNGLLLRAMMQAKYSAENKGHYALASEHYVHFTSPIRRYPDLVVHRALKKALKLEAGALEADPVGISAACSNNERRAVDAEREAVNLCRAIVLKDRIGESFAATVTGVAEFGLFVEIDSPYCEGMLPVGSLGDDYYEYDADADTLTGRRNKRQFAVGTRLFVTVNDVNIARRQVSFVEARPQTVRKKPAGAPEGGVKTRALLTEADVNRPESETGFKPEPVRPVRVNAKSGTPEPEPSDTDLPAWERSAGPASTAPAPVRIATTSLDRPDTEDEIFGAEPAYDAAYRPRGVSYDELVKKAQRMGASPPPPRAPASERKSRG